MALSRRNRQALDIWPGFVDALATLLMVIIFLLMIFVISQLYLNDALVGRDAALDRLNRQIADMAEQLGLERAANEDLRANIDSVSQQLRTSLSRRDDLESELSTLRGQRNAILSQLDAAVTDRDRLLSALADAEGRLADLEVRAAATRNELNDNRQRLQRNEQALAANRVALSESQAALAASQAALDESQAALAQNQASLNETQAALDASAANLAATQQELEITQKAAADQEIVLSQSRRDLEDAYATIDANKKTIEAQLTDLDRLSRDIVALQALRNDLLQTVSDLEAANLAKDEELEITEETLQTNLQALDESTEAALLARAEAARLAQEVEALKEQMGRLNRLLEESEAKDAEQQAQIVDLGRRLNVALASKVQELARYRSEFFGRLREILGNRSDVQIVGDRFVFQSEVLFSQGSDELGEEGRTQLGQLAETLITISSNIPDEINWVLRVDGHTDSIPISTSRFPSNWELSAARAISVVKFLSAQGIPEQRLAATGFGEYQPLDPAENQAAYRKNRRIELKLTER